jgi:cytochrome c556
MNRLVWMASVAVALAALAAPASAQLKPEELVKLRQGVMIGQKAQVGPMSAVAKGEAQLSDATVQQAETLAALTKLAPAGFAPESQKANVPTKAKPEVWQKNEEFKKYAQTLQTEAAKLAEVARKRDTEGFKKQFGATTAACKSCHDDFRAQ